MAHRTKILLLIPHLGGGGSEHVITLLARGLSREKYELHLALVTAPNAGAVALPPWITLHVLGAARARTAAFPLLRLVWRLRPHVVLSGAVQVNFMALLLRPFFPPNTCVLVRQSTTVTSVLGSGAAPWYTRWLYRLLYRRADRVISQSRAMAEDLVRATGIRGEQIAVLPNPIDIEGIRAAQNAPPSNASSLWSGDGPHLLAIGRLAPEKGFDLLLEALAAVRQQIPAADLIIAGAGRDAAALHAKSQSLGLEKAVHFAGHVAHPYAFFPGATLFVLSSRYEGMPNSLLEAAAAGLPIVATPASGGVVDLLRSRPGAWLAAEISSESLTEALLKALHTLTPGARFFHSFFPSCVNPAALSPLHAAEEYNEPQTH